MQTATNRQTGETVVLVNGQWQKADRIASNDKGGRAYLVGGQWMTDNGSATLPKPQDATAGERGAAALGGVNRGLAGLAGLPVDTVTNAMNLGIAAVGVAGNELGLFSPPEPIQKPFGGSEYISEKMQKAGVPTTNPRPDDTVSRMLYTAGTIAGGSVVPGARPVGTAAAAAGGAMAGEALGPEYVGVGAMTPSATSAGAVTAKNAVAARTAPNLQSFKNAGAEATVGQATDSAFIQGLENLAAKFPGGVGTMRKFAETQQKAMGSKVSTGTSAEDAGRAIERGIKGQGGFLQRSKETWQRLDDAVAAKVPQGSAFQPSATVQALDELTAPIKGAEATTGGFVSPRIAQIKENMAKDLAANNGQMPFEALRRIRSDIGRDIENSLVTGGAPQAELKKLYGALSSDLEAAATQAGAGKEFARQNEFYRSRMDRIESVLERVIGKDGGKLPEDVFKSFFPADADAANKVRAVMRSLEPEQRQIVTEAVVNRLGRATPGKQNEMGDIFSSETFLTNWNKLSDGAKAQLFPNHSMRQSVDGLAKASSIVRESSKRLANPSGTAGQAAPYGLGAMVATGHVIPAAGLVGSTYLGAKMLTNQKIVEWLAKPVNPGSQETAAHLARLSVIYNQTSDPELKKELEQFMASAQK